MFTSAPKNVRVNFQQGAKQTLTKLFGRDLLEAEIAGVFGGLDDSIVLLETRDEKIWAQVFHPYFKKQEYFAEKDSDGDLFIRLDFIERGKNAPAGTALESLVRQIAFAQQQKAAYLSAFAEGTPQSAKRGGFAGFCVWVLYGFDALLTQDERRKLPSKFQNVTRLTELFLQGGRKWWIENGNEREVFFDLAENSLSFQVLQKYLKEKKRK